MPLYDECPMLFRGSASLVSYLRDLHEKDPVSMVNVGARWTFNRWDADPVWELAKLISWSTSPSSSEFRAFRVLAFEADEDSYRTSMQRVRTLLGRNGGGSARGGLEQEPRVTFLHMKVDPATVAHVMRQHRVSTNFSILKVDVDSIDLPVADAIVRVGGYRPRLIVAEFNQFAPWPLEFAALMASNTPSEVALLGRPLNPSYAGDYRGGSNRVWPCMGTSLAAWVSWAKGVHYSLLTTDGHSNLVLMPDELRARASSRTNAFNTSSSVVLCGHAEATVKQSRERGDLSTIFERHSTIGLGLTPVGVGEALRMIDASCAKTETPYRFGLEGVCCPRRFPIDNQSAAPSYDRWGRRKASVQFQQSTMCRCNIHPGET